MTDLSASKLEHIRIVAGVWEGILTAPDGTVPVIEASHMGRSIEGIGLQPVPDNPAKFVVRVPIPAWALNEGVQTFLIRWGQTNLAQFSLLAGEPLEQDLRAEINLLRAELDLLKRSFQRHLRES